MTNTMTMGIMMRKVLVFLCLGFSKRVLEDGSGVAIVIIYYL